jgi:hypothetical protein
MGKYFIIYRIFRGSSAVERGTVNPQVGGSNPLPGARYRHFERSAFCYAKSRAQNMVKLRHALEASWDEKTSFQSVSDKDNPALGQCYPTSRVVQFFYPETEIVEGKVWTGNKFEKHFWNVLEANGHQYHIDFTWQQFPSGSIIKSWKTLDRNKLGDGPNTIKRVELLQRRVKNYLAQ